MTLSNSSSLNGAERSITDQLNGYEIFLKQPQDLSSLERKQSFSVLAKKNIMTFQGEVIHIGEERFSQHGKGILEIDMNYNFFLGGDDNQKHSIPSQLFITDEEHELPNVPIAVSCSAVNFHDHYLYLMGGFDGKKVRDDCYQYDFITGAWTKISSMMCRKASISSEIYEDDILIFGGVDGKNAVKNIESYSTSNNKWSVLNHLKYARSACSTSKINDKIYIFGGIGINCLNNIPLEIYDCKTNTLKTMENIIFPSASGESFAYHFQGKSYILLMGGAENFNRPRKTCYLYDVEKNLLEEISPFKIGRQYLSVGISKKNKIIAFGGFTGEKITKTCQTFNFKTKKWQYEKIPMGDRCGMGHFCGRKNANQKTLKKPKIVVDGNWTENKLNGKVNIKVIGNFSSSCFSENDEMTEYVISGEYLSGKKHGAFTNSCTNKTTWFFNNEPCNEETFHFQIAAQKIESIPEDFLCPISYEIMFDPVITECGMTYERKNIEKWLIEHKTDPLTNREITTSVYPNIIFRKKVIEFLNSSDN